MNCLPPTSLFFMGTLHHVQSRSGRSIVTESVSDEGGMTIDMQDIVSERRETCQPTGGRRAHWEEDASRRVRGWAGENWEEDASRRVRASEVWGSGTGATFFSESHCILKKS
jgi:hypothetical protein